MSSRAGGGAGNTSSSASNILTENEKFNEECEVFPICAHDVVEGQETCRTWFHRKCLKIPLKQYKLHAMSPKPWFCNNCPSQQQDDFSLKWGCYDGLVNILEKFQEIYSQYFLPPTVYIGKVGKDFIKELTRLICLLTNKTHWEPVALDMVHIFLPLMQQKPTTNSRFND